VRGELEVPDVISAREERFMSVAAKIKARREALGLDLKTVAATRTPDANTL
jgi:hypothetical protein